jgi:putative transposase
MVLELCLKPMSRNLQNTGKGLSRGYIQGLLPALKKEYEWLKDPYSQCLQVVALNLSTAYKNFFDKRAMLPKFKSSMVGSQLAILRTSSLMVNYINLPKIGLVHCRIHKNFEGCYQNCYCIS